MKIELTYLEIMFIKDALAAKARESVTGEIYQEVLESLTKQVEKERMK